MSDFLNLRDHVIVITGAASGMGQAIARAASREGALFPVALKRNSRQRMARIIRRRDADHDARIGVPLIARILAHAIGDDAPRLRSRGNHCTAGTHAEAVDGAAIAAMMHKFIVGGAK